MHFVGHLKEEKELFFILLLLLCPYIMDTKVALKYF